MQKINKLNTHLFVLMQLSQEKAELAPDLCNLLISIEMKKYLSFIYVDGCKISNQYKDVREAMLWEEQRSLRYL